MHGTQNLIYCEFLNTSICLNDVLYVLNKYYNAVSFYYSLRWLVKAWKEKRENGVHKERKTEREKETKNNQRRANKLAC